MKNVLDVLPKKIRESISPSLWEQGIEEIRLRLGREVSIICGSGEYYLSSTLIRKEDLEHILAKSCGFSFHTVQTQVSNGFLTISGGHRVGLCGTVVLEKGKIMSIRNLTSLSIRIAREWKGIASDILPQLFEEDEFQSTLLLSPPGHGKTTLLRELICSLSDCKGIRLAVVDERQEIAGNQNGSFRFDLGRSTDILDGCPKNLALPFLLRSMNPQIIAVDEITAKEDVQALKEIVGCGVKLLATAHGTMKLDLYRRKIYEEMMELQLFQRLLLIGNQGTQRNYEVEVLS